MCNGFVTSCRGSWRHAQYRSPARQLPGLPRPRLEIPPVPAGLDGRDLDPGPGRVRPAFLPGLPGLGQIRQPTRLMTADDGTAPAGGQPGSTGQDYWDGLGLALTWRSLVFGRAGAPLWMRAELVRLGTAFPAFSFSIRPGWRGLIFEAWREAGADGLYAVITQDPRELWRELDAVPGSTSPVTDRSGGEAR